MRRALVLSFLLALAAAAPAHAGWRLDRSKAIAAIVWRNPCAGQVTVEVAPLPAEEFGEAYIEDCRIVLNLWATRSWERVCATVIHEYGHVAGFRDPTNVADPIHSANPKSVMYAGEDLTDGALLDHHGLRIDARCSQRGRPFLRRHGQLR